MTARSAEVLTPDTQTLPIDHPQAAIRSLIGKGDDQHLHRQLQIATHAALAQTNDNGPRTTTRWKSDRVAKVEVASDQHSILGATNSRDGVILFAAEILSAHGRNIVSCSRERLL